MIVIYLLLVLAAVFYYFLAAARKKYTYWQDRGVAQLNPVLIYGDAKDMALRKRQSSEMYREFYYAFKKKGVKFGGIYLFNRPILVLVDPSILKLVLIKDFQHFSAHNPKIGDTLLFKNIFHLDGEPWKDMRKKLTPTFTSGKMKMMFFTLLQKAMGLTDLVGKLITAGESLEIKDVLARYTTDIIGSCGFGIECNSLGDKGSEFFIKGQQIFERLTPPSSPSAFRMFLIAIGLVKFFSFDLLDIEDFFREISKKTIKYREENKVLKKDFLQLMIQLKNKGSVTDLLDEKDVYQKTDGKETLSMEDIAGQCMFFFTAGFETSSSTMTFAFLELAQHPDIQEKLRKEVREVLKKYDGNLSYEALQEMTYCNNVIEETLRKYPIVANLTRMCTKTYQIPDTNVIIEKGTSVEIPIFAIQNDPDYFPEPEKFIPDRFKAANRSKISDCTYMPFGEGPRQCLGLRFGMMQSKAGIASLINRYSFTLDKRTPYPPKLNPSAPLLSVQGGVWLHAKVVD